MSLSGSIALQIQGVLTASRDLGSSSVGETLASRITVADGAIANSATQVWGDTRELAASTSEDLDLSGSLSNGLGESVALTRVVALMVTANSGNGGTISVGGAAANGFASWVDAADNAVKVRPGGALVLIAPDLTGYAVTTGTGDLLAITNDDSGDAATYSILVMGSEA